MALVTQLGQKVIVPLSWFLGLAALFAVGGGAWAAASGKATNGPTICYLLRLVIAAPLHGVCALLCARDARFFDLILLWGKTRMPAYFANYRVWKASSHGPLPLDPPTVAGRRRAVPAAQVGAPTLLRSSNRTSESRRVAGTLTT